MLLLFLGTHFASSTKTTTGRFNSNITTSLYSPVNVSTFIICHCYIGTHITDTITTTTTTTSTTITNSSSTTNSSSSTSVASTGSR